MGLDRCYNEPSEENSMSRSYLGHFLHSSGNKFKHEIDTETDVTYLTDSDGTVVYTVNSDAYLFDSVGHIGTFRMNNLNHWYFQCLSGIIIETEDKYLIKAEMKVFKNLLDDENAKILWNQLNE